MSRRSLAGVVIFLGKRERWLPNGIVAAPF